jgi:hypothetical protein
MTRFLGFVGVVGLLLLAVLGLIAMNPASQAPLNQALNDLASQAGQAQTVLEAKGTTVGTGQPLPSLELSPHAYAEHAEASSISDCIHKNGFYQIWKDTKVQNKFYGICKINDNFFGLAVFNDSLKGNKTAFAPGSGCWKDIMNYVMKYATKFTGGIPVQ